MPLLYEETKPSATYLLTFKTAKPLTQNQIRRLKNSRAVMEQKAHILIHKIEAQDRTIKIYFSPIPTLSPFAITWPIVILAGIIASIIGIPLISWAVQQVPTGPLGLPTIFWIGIGIAIPLIAGAILLYMWRKE